MGGRSTSSHGPATYVNCCHRAMERRGPQCCTMALAPREQGAAGRDTVEAQLQGLYAVQRAAEERPVGASGLAASG